ECTRRIRPRDRILRRWWGTSADATVLLLPYSRTTPRGCPATGGSHPVRTRRFVTARSVTASRTPPGQCGPSTCVSVAGSYFDAAGPARSVSALRIGRATPADHEDEAPRGAHPRGGANVTVTKRPRLVNHRISVVRGQLHGSRGRLRHLCVVACIQQLLGPSSRQSAPDHRTSRTRR